MRKKAETTQQGANEEFMKEPIQRNQTDKAQPVGYSQSVVELNSGPLRTNPVATGESGINPFTVVCLVSTPLNESEAGPDLVVMKMPQLFLCKIVLISIITASLTQKQGGFYHKKVNISLTLIRRPGI